MIKIILRLGFLLPFYSTLTQGESAEEDKNCAAYLDFGYYCVPYFQCNKTGYINTDGDQIVDPRMADDVVFCPDHELAQRGHCQDLLEVCCLHPVPTCISIPKENRSSYDDYEYYYEEYEEYREDYDYDYKEGCITDDIFGESGKNKNVLKDCNKENKCEDFKKQGFACAEYWQCYGKERSPVISDGFGKIDLRQNQRPTAGGCVYLENATLDASDEKCSGETQVCCKNPDYDVTVCDPEETESFAECGRTNRPRTGRVVTVTQLNVNNAAQPGEFPHMCIIYKVENGKTEYLGGASLIARNKVITVAHKFLVFQKHKRKIDERKHLEKFRVRCGEYNVKAETEIQQTQETGILAFYFHPQYDPTNKFVPNDLVIIETKKKFIYQEHIGPVCLPRPKDNFENDVDCWSSGWGKDQFGQEGKFSDILKKIDMKIVNEKECQLKLRKYKRFLKSFEVHKSQVCVGGEKNKDTCTGDGGSPHVCLRDGKWTQVGAVAWGIGCGESIPAIYASISDAMCWIDFVMTCRPENSPNIRTRKTKSTNGLTMEECGQWAEDNVRLIEDHSCEVIYLKNDVFDVEDDIFSEADSDIFSDIADYYDYDIRSDIPKRSAEKAGAHVGFSEGRG